MPTGYTAGVIDGTMTDFRDFALQCARAFGACIMQRDDPMHEPPKPREVASYYGDAVQRAEAEVLELEGMTAADVATACELEYQRAAEAYSHSQRKAHEARQRIEAMLVALCEWRPPTPDHVGLRDFMVEQLQQTMKWDGQPWGDPPRLRTASEYVTEERRRRLDAVKSATQSLSDEQRRVREANEWITALYESLGLPGTGAVRSPENAPSREDGAAPVSPDRPERPERATPPWHASHQRT